MTIAARLRVATTATKEAEMTSTTVKALMKSAKEEHGFLKDNNAGSMR